MSKAGRIRKRCPFRRDWEIENMKAYTEAGVDIAKAERLLREAKADLRSAVRPEMLGKIGGFGGLFDISSVACAHPVLCASTDGVGTKVKLAAEARRFKGIGHDIVNHCCNDIAVVGAEPLFFLDYYGTGHLDEIGYAAVLKSLANACREAGVALLGGETAEMPGVYGDGDFDLVGTIVGVVDRDKILSGDAIRAGDKVIGIASSGLHTNGYTLARRIAFEKAGLALGESFRPGSPAIEAAMLEPHVNYARLIRSLTRSFNAGSSFSGRAGNTLFGAAHITGGGFNGNIPRILPDNVSATVDCSSWQVPDLFAFLVDAGGLDFDEAYEVFNMGIGLVLIVDPNNADAILKAIHGQGFSATLIGETVVGEQTITLTGAA